jgi:glucose/arabinose dehydrogenase/cytochrome c2
MTMIFAFSSRVFASSIFFFSIALPVLKADPASPVGDAGRGKALFTQSCALCHSDGTGAGNPAIAKQGPSLLGVFGRKAGTGPNFNYTQALSNSGITWDAASLDHFLTNPAAAVPGTTMPIPVPDAQNRADLIAYLGTLKFTDKDKADAAKAAADQKAADDAAKAKSSESPAAASAGHDDDWQNAVPGKAHRIVLDEMPAPFATRSVGNGPKVVARPDGAMPSAPAGFAVTLFASGLSNPRCIRIAPNGDIFLSETGANRIHVFRAAAGAETPSENQIFAEGLNRPFGIAFYPPGNDPKWIYIANNNSVVRIPYRNGDLKAEGEPQVIVPQLTESNGGHSTRDVAFSLDGKRMFISVGSGSNIADGMSKKSVEDAQKWEAEHGLGAAWDGETNRADILVCDPEGHDPLHTYATGIRNGVGIAVDPANGKLWTSTNERDGLGDDLVPDYITSVKEGGFYGWPWYYMGDHEEPRLKGERPDLAGHVLAPDVPVQAHSASLEMTFYPATTGVAAFPADYQGDIFAAFHGSWNRNTRTGYEVVRVRRNHGVATGEYDDFLTGFVVDNSSVWGRPVGVAVAHDGALLVSEDGNGTLWRVAPAR